ncbi:related to nitrate assimilation regulatory protein nirA [Phialocephala subalpina]|uniref:Related to nitrate assimilation regulatory protein nirA n=1 Tax=Phialocephala subalpina TaxID=576137 RepID=A0A1L7XA46_9HELO|nr:related to nitrate assimilation regulatory protein nirA [Phialocephala subalpina]
MPRPRVRPADRQRAPKACVTCKVSKKRCDANLPCALCVRKGRAESCTYPDVDEKGRSSRSRSPRTSPQPPRGRGVLGPDTFTRASELRERELESESVTRESSPQCSQRPTMLLSSRGEQVYIGNVAALSFLQFLQKTLKRYIGPSAFTERRRGETMLEAEVQNNSTAQFQDGLDTDQKHDLVRCFMRVSNGILHLFSEEDIHRLLGLKAVQVDHLNSNPQRDDFAFLYLMIAIGAQCRGSSSAEIKMAARYFARAQQVAFVDMLQDPSLAMIKIFLMMAFYMLGACRRNTAFMYIGIASKAATILGLHIPYQNARASAEQRAVRRRTWMSLRVLDLLCSSILARPSSTPTIQGDGYETEDVSNDSRDHRTLALRANYESSSIIDIIVQSCTKSSNLDIKSAENYLQMLREWSQALPEVLRCSPKPRSDNRMLPVLDSRETTIGNIHVSCTYYFGVILVTRQFLISRVMSQLRDRNPSAPSEGEAVKTSQFSNGCVSSAVFMAQLCSEASRNNVLLDNMCLLKAWLFSAGLVLGFSLLVEEEDWPNARDAFTRTRETLQKLSRLSPQAQQYYEILTRFSSAIELYKKQLLARQKSTRNPFVEQIMTFEEGASSSWQDGIQSHVPPPGLLRTPEPSVINGDEVLGLEAGDLGYQFDMPPFATQIGDDIGLQWMWDNYAMQLPNFVTSWDEAAQQSLGI